METKYRISVLMAIYNCADTLSEAIDSLYAQTYDNFKLILCDDGSTDSTYEIAQSYASKHDNIILLKNDKNRKLAYSLNHCLKYADTEYIARMDGDDISLPTRFEKQINFLDTHPEYAVVSTPMIYFDENGDWGEGTAIEKPGIDVFKTQAPHTHAPAMVRTKVMKEVNGYTDNKWTLRNEDFDLWHKIYKAGFRGYNLQEPLYKMRDDQNALDRRTAYSRYIGFVNHIKIMRNLNLKNWFFWSFVAFIRFISMIILPKKTIQSIRINKLRKQFN